MVGFQRTGRVWSSGNVPKEPHWPNMWLQPWGRSLNQHLWLVLVCPDSSHADTQQVPLPNALGSIPKMPQRKEHLTDTESWDSGDKKGVFSLLLLPLCQLQAQGDRESHRFYRYWSHFSLPAGTIWEGVRRKQLRMDSLLPENHHHPQTIK